MFSSFKKSPKVTAEETNKNEIIKVDNSAAYESAIKALRGGCYDLIEDTSDPVNVAINDLSKSLFKNTKEMLENVVNLSIQSSESLSSICFVTGDIRDVSDNTQTIAAAVEEFCCSIREISESSQRVSDTASETETTVGNGKRAVEESIENINTITQSMDTANLKIQSLSDSVEAIVAILGTIETIAKQTNLLALNATIEAARAGEAGRGFAIVASEVKTLASQTALATEDIRDKIETISSEMGEVSEAMVLSVSATDSGRESINKAGEEINTVVDNIQNVTQLISSVAASVLEQDTVIKEIAHSIEVIQGKTKLSEENSEHALDATNDSAKVIDEQILKYRSMDIPNSIVDFAKSDHVLWKKRLAAMLVGKSNLTADELVDHHSCALGKWYDNVNDKNIKNHKSFIEMENYHSLVHNHGKKSAELFAKGDRVSAAEEYKKMSDASVHVIKCLEELKSHLSR